MHVHGGSILLQLMHHFTVTVCCDAPKALIIGEYVLDFVCISQLFARHRREMALICITIENLIH